ncbi:MAG: phosphofructokinase [Ignavibacteria bacterium GWA2_55_11]|nr:MAG: phosphofructokinase [Ignavibacteria bacterium GWA2_55_11]OGU66016.1 MAG: phosphofructokinase [Ignavibacteria bacterium RIFCSPHIGHO2_02_FULL_56_12]OGU69400.1 MAG: phosphofructokinase [Ignavibacteria bacterium RIFCSPLOWO2_02_FULL_55_14]
MNIAILTGGGDVPGLNPCIKAVVYRAQDQGMQVVGVRRGWAGLLNYNPDDPGSLHENFVDLNKINTRTVDRTGGTFLHTSRTNPQKVSKEGIPAFLRTKEHDALKSGEKVDLTKHVLRTIAAQKIDAIISIGGDDTQSFALRLHKEGIPVVSIPKTMDNDVFGTDYCIGFSTAVTRSVDFITSLRTVAGSHERIAIVELFGRNSGETSLISAYLAGVDRAIISEVPFDVERLAAFLMEDKKANPSNYAIMTISEGAHFKDGTVVETGPEDAYGHRKLGGIGVMVEERIKKILGSHTVYQQIAYLMRSGEPDALDRMVAISYANLAIDLVARKQFGKMVALRDGRYTYVAIETIGQGLKRVDVGELYDIDQYKPKVVDLLNKPMFLY